MTTALIPSRASEIYQKIDNPLAFVEQMGKSFHQSQIMGISTAGDGAILALTCMCEGITPLEFAKTYHIINGRPSMRADMMHAKFRSAGGKVKWINLGDDGKAAEAEFTFDGQTLPVKYTIEDARNVVGDKVDKPDSNWRKDRGAMLRARLFTKAIRILAPELIAGVYTPEELEDSGEPAKPAKSASQRHKETAAEFSVISDPVAEASTPAAEEIIDAVVEVPAETPPFETETTQAPAETAAAPVETAAIEDDSELPVTPDLLQEVAKLGGKFPSKANPGKAMDIKEISEGICAACKVERVQLATRRQIRSIIERWRAALGGS